MEVFDYLDERFAELSGVVGQPPDQLKFIIVLLTIYPAAIVFQLLPRIPALLHVYSILLSWFFCTLCLGYTTH